MFPAVSFSLAAPRHRMVDHARLDELRRRYAEHPRRYFAPLASALRRAGDAPAAIEVTRRALVDAPEHLTGYVILAQALADVGDRAGARRAFERAHDLDEGNVVALQSLVTIARADGDDAAGARWTALLREADPEPAHAAHEAPGEPPDDTVGGDFELLDYVEIAAPAQTADSVSPAAPAAEADPVVGLDEPPADPLPAPIRDALPTLLDDPTLDVTPPAGVAENATRDREMSEVEFDDLDEDAPPATPPAAPFVTETMAGLLAAQGHTTQALDVYAQLLAQRPGDPRLLAQVAALRGERPPAGDDAVRQDVPLDAEPHLPRGPSIDPPGSPASATSAAQHRTEHDADERAARMWRAAFAPLPREASSVATGHEMPNEATAAEPPAAVAPAAAASSTGAAGDPSLDDLSFDHFFEAFGEEPAPTRSEPTGDFERWAAEADLHPVPEQPAPGSPETPVTMPAIASIGVTAAATASTAFPASPAPLLTSSTPDDPEADLAEFNAWLRSLAG